LSITLQQSFFNTKIRGKA